MRLRDFSTTEKHYGAVKSAQNAGAEIIARWRTAADNIAFVAEVNKARVLSRFGNITLSRATYRQGSRGRTIAPLEKIPGIQCGATPGAQDLVGRQVAAQPDRRRAAAST